MYIDILIKFENKVHLLRKQRSWSVEKLPQETNLYPNYVSDIERGTRNITLKATVKIANGLNVSIIDLLKEDGG